jgi:hypothetical protein
MQITEYDLRLYRLLKTCLLGDYVSVARDPLTPRMRAGMLSALRTTEIKNRCSCGQTSCHSFTTTNEPKEGEELYTVRFRARAELQVTCDAAGIIYRVQWLTSEPTVGTKLRCYEAAAEGFVERPVAGT